MSIVLTDPDILHFFREHPQLDPNKTVKLCVNFLASAIPVSDVETSPAAVMQLSQKIDTLQHNLQAYLSQHLNNSSLQTRGLLEVFSKDTLQHIAKTTVLSTNSAFQGAVSAVVVPSEQRITHSLQQLGETIHTNAVNTKSTLDQLTQLTAKFNNSSQKGRLSENLLQSVLTQVFSSAEIINTTGESHSCDFLIRRMGHADVLVENKVYTRNVDTQEINKFLADIKRHGCSGILLSQDSGIANKSHFQIDISGQSVIVYLHHVGYNPETIELAVNVIDHITQALQLYLDENTGTGIALTDAQVDAINKELSQFLIQKETLVKTLKETHKDIIGKVNAMKFPKITALLKRT
ncbi:hypothetical protein EB118_11670 [bacterium]|nr:hypothetical protein [bacterium]NDC94898.1 hypothetical protein [bacterium]NDD84636.1 hypothetical protein [bacterium]NDG30717.1 hypothetical protein [bacterium]